MVGLETGSFSQALVSENKTINNGILILGHADPGVAVAKGGTQMEAGPMFVNCCCIALLIATKDGH